MATEQELLSQLEELRKKQKEMEEQNKDVEFNKQRNFLIKTVRDFLGIKVCDEEVCAILYKYCPIGQYHTNQIEKYLKKEDENMLFERKVSNRYARYHEIRCEDSDMIIQNFIKKIQPLITPEKFNQEQNEKSEQNRLEQRIQRNNGIKISEYIREKYVPLFC
jgi:hypothetical protein